MEYTIIEQINSNKKTKFIKFDLENDTLSREWGLRDGATQVTKHTYSYINKGKKNELSPKQAAHADYERILRKKCKEGYTIVESTTYKVIPLINNTNEIDSITLPLTHLPTEFCCSKPTAKANDKKINQACKEGNVQFNIKHNGLCHYIFINYKQEIILYTRRMDDHTAKYPKIVEAVKQQNYPPGTVLITEFIVEPENLSIFHLEAFRLISKISKIDTLKGKLQPDQSRSFHRQQENPVRVCVFGVLYYAFDPVWTQMTQGEIEKVFLQKLPDVTENYTLFKPIIPTGVTTLNQAKKYIKKAGDNLEGLVVWMLNEKMEVTFNGKPKRRCSYKLKVAKETDVIATGWNEGKGNRQGLIGALKIGEYCKDGTWRDLGTIGSGIEDGEADPTNWKFPCVIEIEYDNRFPDTGKFQFPRFNKVHAEKIPEDLGWKEKKEN